MFIVTEYAALTIKVGATCFDFMVSFEEKNCLKTGNTPGLRQFLYYNFIYTDPHL